LADCQRLVIKTTTNISLENKIHIQIADLATQYFNQCGDLCGKYSTELISTETERKSTNISVDMYDHTRLSWIDYEGNIFNGRMFFYFKLSVVTQLI